MKTPTVPCVYCGELIEVPGCFYDCNRTGCASYSKGNRVPDGCLKSVLPVQNDKNSCICCGLHKIRIPRVVIKSITGDDSEAFGEGLKEATAVYVDGEFVGSGVYFGSPEDRLRGRDFAWVEELLFNLCKALEIPAAIGVKTVTPEEWDKIVR